MDLTTHDLAIDDQTLYKVHSLIDFNPVNAFVWYNKAIALRNLGRSKEADEAIRVVNFPRGSPSAADDHANQRNG